MPFKFSWTYLWNSPSYIACIYEFSVLIWFLITHETSNILYFLGIVESDKTTSIYNVSTRVLSKK